MKEISSTEARTHFGALLDMAQREPLARLMPLQQRTYRFTRQAEVDLKDIYRYSRVGEGKCRQNAMRANCSSASQ